MKRKMNKKNNIYIIAEIGINHNGSIKIAKRLINDAKLAGANAVKFQVFEPETLAKPAMIKTKEQKKYIRKKLSLEKMWKKVSFSEKQLKEISIFSKKNKIDFICSVFDETSLKKVIRIGIKYLKVASSDINDIYLLNLIKKTNKEVILSTGMSNLKEIKNALKILGKKTIVLHCVSKYPCPIKLANLKRINKLKKILKAKVGYSDHTVGTNACKIAITLGAQVIEKHFTYNKKIKGADHILSADKKDLEEIVNFANNYEKYLGSGKILPSRTELSYKKFFRKGLYFSQDLKKNYKLKIKDIAFQRPPNLMDVNKYKSLIGKKIKRDVLKFESISGKLLY
jgi:N,N'-diacetyllegionaminate synthase